MTAKADWPTTRARIVEAFDGELPGAGLEQAIVDIYETNPAAIVNAIDSIATSVQAGTVRSGWAVLKAAAIKKTIANSNPTIARERAIAAADRWLRHVGHMYDRYDEVQRELFEGNFTKDLTLKPWRDTKLENRYREAWETVRHEGEQIEAEELERSDNWKANHAKLTEHLTPSDPAGTMPHRPGQVRPNTETGSTSGTDG